MMLNYAVDPVLCPGVRNFRADPLTLLPDKVRQEGAPWPA
jgi:hypothetical protein